MDPIIRAARVSPVARRIGRVLPAAAAAPVRAHADVAPAVQPAPAVSPRAPAVQVSPAMPAPAPKSAPAPAAMAALQNPAAPALASSSAAPVSAPAAAPADTRDYAAEMARAAAEHKAALQQRDDEIAALRKAAQEATLALTDAFTDAEQRGYAAGEEKGAKAARAALQAQIDRAAALASEVDEARQALMDSNEDVMVEIVFAALCRILGEQGATRETVAAVVRETIAATREREQIVVRLHPDDAALFRDTAVEHAGAELRMCADPAVKLGGCIVDGASGSLDARFETQLGLLAAALKQARAARQQDAQ